MKSIEFQKFIDLVAFDQDLISIENKIKQSQDIQNGLLADIQRLQTDFQDIKQAQQQARMAVDEKELSMKVLDGQEAALKKKLEAVSNQKEFKSLEKETLAVNEQRIAQEQQLVVLWNKLEALGKTYEFKHKLFEEQSAQFHEQVEKVTQEIATLHEELKNLLALRQEKEQGVPQEWLDMYINMKGKVSNPVVPVVGDSCDACFYSVIPRDLQALRQNKLMQCRDCYRLLYIA